MVESAESIASWGEPTHAVFNQTPELAEDNLFVCDPVLQAALQSQGAAFCQDALVVMGAQLGQKSMREAAHLANQHGPVLTAFDARGLRIDRIAFHPAWHQLMTDITHHRLHNGPWAAPRAGAHAARAAAYILQTQIESGSLCPTTMTYGAIPAVARDPDLARDWLPALLTDQYDARDLPVAMKQGGLIGMGMTEKQGGSDVRANTTRAEPTSDGSYRLNGHKWFYSAPQCDAHLVLAQEPAGLSCFFVPRFAPDGEKNGVLIQRLKDKLGNRSNASAEVEFRSAYAHRLGAPGRGIPTILEMGTYTRLDCVSGSAGLMRQVLVQALHHASYRQVFGRRLLEQPLMHQVLVDLCLESAAATLLAMRLARAFDALDSDEHEHALRRLMTPAAKFWVCKRGPEVAAEAMEVLGGNGYVEELPLARIYREMPVNSIWEGSGNVMCLDVLRALSKTPATRAALLAELHAARGRHALFDTALESLGARLETGAWPEHEARYLVWQLVVLFQAALLLRYAAPVLAESFCATRLGARRGAVFGSFSGEVPAREIFAASWQPTCS